MKDVQKFVGLDVSKEMISVGVAEAGRGEPRFYGNVPKYDGAYLVPLL
jgi:transposase